MKKIKELYYNIKDGIINLIFWIPIIWKDRDFDSFYMYTMYYKKLEKMINYFESENCVGYIGIEKDIKRMKICKYILQRLVDSDINTYDNYLRMIYRYNNIDVNLYNDIDLDYNLTQGQKILTNPFMEEFYKNQKPKIFDTNFSTKKYKEIFERTYRHQDYMCEQYLTMFSKYFAKYSKKWWD